MMAFLRNREIRIFALLMAAICVIAVITGFVISFITGVFTTILCGLFCMAFFVFTRKRYRDIAFLGEQIDIVLHGKDGFDLNMFNEGELSILQSEIHKMTVRLKEQSDMLKKEKVYLSDSIADIAHQLKTPLTSINMIVSFLGHSDLEPQHRLELVGEMKSLLARIDWLITTLLKISKIDAGTAIFQKEPVSVPILLQKAAEPFLIPLELRNIELRVNGDGVAQFTGDLRWTSEAIGNILKNCMEHCENGGLIEIDYTPNPLFTEIIIKDNGSGIDADDLPHIFERFYQGKDAKDSSFGVGLALGRMILSLQNATIKAANRTDGGACFTIRFYQQVV
ncbi:sensor histidine kinase [Syntrophomonas wolfei]|jgi:signal transduction histidine kinase|uniref:sensor histidine kinase n=2 Tax=Syntrophomonas wolfei TaxID=863 RepID=UPI0023F1BBCC|nr:HAMP domain-containing sensor histidine kinase [Syntrophomonas wolfei]